MCHGEPLTINLGVWSKRTTSRVIQRPLIVLSAKSLVLRIPAFAAASEAVDDLANLFRQFRKHLELILRNISYVRCCIELRAYFTAGAFRHRQELMKFCSPSSIKSFGDIRHHRE